VFSDELRQVIARFAGAFTVVPGKEIEDFNAKAQSRGDASDSIKSW